MDITTLNHSKEALIKEISEMESILNNLRAEMKKVASFSVWQFDEDYIIQHSQYFRFYYRDNRDLSLTYFNDEDTGKDSIHFGWGSWSFTDMNGEDIQKAQEYIEQVSECLRNIGSDCFKKSVDLAREFYKNNMSAVVEKYLYAKRALDEIEKNIKEIEHEEEMKSIKNFFDENLGKVFKFHRPFEISRGYSSNVIEVSKDKKGYNIKFYDRYKRAVSDEILKDLYNHISKKVVFCDYMNSDDDEYSKYDMITNDLYEKINYEKISKEEYCDLKKR